MVAYLWNTDRKATFIKIIDALEVVVALQEPVMQVASPDMPYPTLICLQTPKPMPADMMKPGDYDEAQALSLIRMWYHKPKARNVGLDPATVQVVQRIGGKRPAYGTRRMAAQVCRETHTATNRKKIQRIFRKLGWIEPQKTKNDIVRTNRKLFKPDAPNQLWETDMTYVWCRMDGWCYCFNVVDCFTRKWISYAFDVDAIKQVVIDSITNTISVENPDCSRLRLRTDNGTQYTSNDFRKAVSVFGIKHEFVWKHTPEQNGHVESFHKTLKKEYLR